MDNILGCFVSGPATYHDSSLADIEFANERGEQFRKFLWNSPALAETLKALRHDTYGKDLLLILFQFYLNPIPFELEHLKKIESYRRKEKSIGIPIIVDEKNFFTKSDGQKYEFVKNIVIEKLNLLDSVVKRNKLDTNLNRLKIDLEQLLNGK